METTRFHSKMQVMGVIALIIGAIILATNFTPQSYFYGWVFWACVAFGFFGLSLLHHMAKGSWGYPVMRLLEAGGGWEMLLLFGLLFTPVWMSWRPALYSWMHEAERKIPIVAAKLSFLDNWYVPFTIAMFLVFVFFAYRNEMWLKKEDETGEKVYLQRRTNWSSFFFPFFVVGINFAVTLWIMSMRPEWYSTMYGIWFVVQQGLAAMAIVAIIIGTQADKEPFKKVVTPALTKDIGNLMLTLTMLWAYFSFSQYLIIWSGNLPEQISYWVERRQGGFQDLGAILIAYGFFVPFLLLLSPRMKREPRRLAVIGVIILIARFLDIHYNVAPMFGPMTGHTAMASLYDAILPKIGSLLAFGGLWCWMFGWKVQRAPLLVKNQPQLKGALENA
ncbi:MAG TPA: hypothetical protein VNI20_13490 [Fimbriimonadaceae bacterium]|nr:hypothetical protein [Fimbriimonadaceae bacterium]